MSNKKPEFGNAKEAAEVLNMSRSQFNEMRLRDTYIYDPIEQTLTKIDRDREDLRDHLDGKHLVAPMFAGQRRIGGKWEYNLDRLREYRKHGPPGAQFPTVGDEHT